MYGRTIAPAVILTDLAQYGGLITRGAVDPAFPNLPGRIIDIDQRYINLGGVKIQGIDASVQFQTPPAPIGRFRFSLSGAYFIMQDYIAPYTNQKAARIRDTLEGRVNTATVAGMRWAFGKDSRLYGYAEYDSPKQSLQGVSVIEFAKNPFRVASRLWSPRVRWSGA